MLTIQRNNLYQNAIIYVKFSSWLFSVINSWHIPELYSI